MMKKNTRLQIMPHFRLLLAVLLCLAAYTSIAQPTNDDCDNAIALDVGDPDVCTQTMATFDGATTSAENTCGDEDVWFSAVVPASGAVSIETYEGTNDDHELDVFSGTCGNLANIHPDGDCQDDDNSPDGSNAEAVTVTGLTPGDIIYILVDDRGDEGTFSICVTEFIPPPDTCEDAIPLEVGMNSTCTQTMTSFDGATNTSDNTCGENDVWFSAIVPCSGELTVETYEGTADDVELDVFSGTCGNLTSINGGCQDDDNGPEGNNMEATTLTGLTPGDVIYIMVDDRDDGGDFSLCVYDPSMPCDAISAIASNIMCDDAGTPDDGMDDMITFEITVLGGCGNTWSDNMGNTGQSYGTAFMYGPFVADGSQAMIVITDEDNPSCAQTTVTVDLNDCEVFENIPTVGEWGLIMLGLLMLITAIIGIRQRREAEITA